MVTGNNETLRENAVVTSRLSKYIDRDTIYEIGFCIIISVKYCLYFQNRLGLRNIGYLYKYIRTNLPF